MPLPSPPVFSLALPPSLGSEYPEESCSAFIALSPQAAYCSASFDFLSWNITCAYAFCTILTICCAYICEPCCPMSCSPSCHFPPFPSPPCDVCSDLFAILKCTEKLERAYIRDGINAKDYEAQCEKLIAQFRMLWGSMKETVRGGGRLKGLRGW